MEAEIAQKMANLAELLGVIDQRRAAATQAIAGVHATLRDIHDSAASQLIAAVSSVQIQSEALADAMRKQASPQIEALRPQIDHIAAAVQQVEAWLSQIATRALELEGLTNETAQGAFDSVSSLLDERQEQFDGLASDCAQFIDVLDELGASLATSVYDLGTALDTALGETDGIIDDVSDRMDVALITPIAEARDALNEFLEQLTDRIAEEVTPEIVDESVQDVVTSLRQSLARLVQSLCDSLDELAAKIMESINEGSGSRAALQPAVDALSSAIDAVMSELNRIKGLASSVGVSI